MKMVLKLIVICMIGSALTGCLPVNTEPSKLKFEEYSPASEDDKINPEVVEAPAPDDEAEEAVVEPTPLPTPEPTMPPVVMPFEFSVNVVSVSSTEATFSFDINRSEAITVEVQAQGVMGKNTSKRSVEVDGLSPGTNYNFSFRTRYNNVDYKRELTIKTPNENFSNFDIQLTSASAQSLSVVVPNQNSSTRYTYYINGVKKAQTDSNSYTFTGLSRATSYSIKVELSANGYNSLNKSKSFTTDKDNFSGVALKIVKLSAENALVEVAQIVGAQKYSFYLNGAQKQSANSSTFDFVDLSPDTEYILEVVVEGQGFNDSRTSLVVRTPKKEFEDFEIQISDVKSSSFKAEVIGASAASKYKFFVNDQAVYEGSAPSFDFINMTANTVFRVKAIISGQGYSDKELEVSVTTLKETLPKLILVTLSAGVNDVEFKVSEGPSGVKYEFYLDKKTESGYVNVDKEVLVSNNGSFSSLYEKMDYRLRARITKTGFNNSSFLYISFTTKEAPKDEVAANAGYKLFLNAGSKSDVLVGSDTYLGDDGQDDIVLSRSYDLANGDVYGSGRYDKAIRYKISVPNGVYSLKTFHYEDYWTSAGNRMFDIVAEGKVLRSSFDIYKENPSRQALLLFDDVEVEDGELNLEFIAIKDNATVSGFALLGPDGEAGTSLQKLNAPVLSSASADASSLRVDIDIVAGASSYTYLLERAVGQSFEVIRSINKIERNHSFDGLEPATTYRVGVIANATGYLSSQVSYSQGIKTSAIKLSQVAMKAQDITASGFSITIHPVSNASNYRYSVFERTTQGSYVQVSGFPKITTAFNLDYSTSKFSTTYKVTISALSNSQAYLESDVREISLTTGAKPSLANVSNLSVSTSLANFEASFALVSNASSYLCYLDAVKSSVSVYAQKSVNVGKCAFDNLPSGLYRVRVVAKGSSQVNDSGESISQTIQVRPLIPNPKITISNYDHKSVSAGLSEISEAQVYKVELLHDSYGVVSGPSNLTNASDRKFSFGNLLEKNKYTIKVTTQSEYYTSNTITAVFTTLAAPVVTPVPTPIPTATPTPQPPISSSARKDLAQLQMGDRRFVSSVLEYVFKLNAPIEAIYRGRDFGGGCDPYAAAGYGSGSSNPTIEFASEFCGRLTSNQPAIGQVMPSVNNAARYAIVTKTCESLVANDTYLNNALSHLGKTSSSATSIEAFEKVYQLFYPYKTMSNELKSKTNQLANKFSGVKDKWKIVVLAFCISPEWQAL